MRVVSPLGSLALMFLVGCATSSAPDPGLEGLAVTRVAPDTIIPGTKLQVTGASFVESQWGDASLVLSGDGGTVRWPATFVDFTTMTIAIDASMIDQIGAEDFTGTATVEVVATSDGLTYASESIEVDLAFRQELDPSVASIEATGVIFVNDQIQIEGDGFLLGGDEGVTVAKLEGCFTPEAGGACAPISELELATQPLEALSRETAVFPFSPKIAGIKPGTFTGRITVINKQKDLAPSPAPTVDVSYDLVTSQIFSVDPPAASLGQYVFVKGGGFVGGESGALTELELEGTFARTGGGSAPVLMTLLPEFVEGRLVRYVVNTDDSLGQALDLRQDTGQFTGTITPVVTFGPDTVRGVSTNASFAIAPVKQVVYLLYQPSYVEGLRDFGLRAVDKKIRERIIEVCKRTYRGVNIEFRDAPPTDFALFEQVELLGVDPNGTGLFGYDNSPGKDNGNERLYDRLGGVNALTQQDGYPGYGGVFIRSLMGFSKHPGSFATSVPGADATFDAIFDPFRSDIGEPVTSSDIAGGLATLTDGFACPGSDRKSRVECAVFVLGNLIGGTLSHEIGHSLGLANPYMEGFHNAGDAPARLMDAGGDRPFNERAELDGTAPGEFCDDEYEYLRQILPSSEAAPQVQRASCF
ncbi:MAG: hypothetical protein H0V17_22840 [Deltaproteobacteria bacterium]|nr:hypothetical protein [Deltaproteobacteria bacterium]